jgi:hypothetical protein
MSANMSCNCSIKVLLNSTASSGHSEAMSANSDTQWNIPFTQHFLYITCFPVKGLASETKFYS